MQGCCTAASECNASHAECRHFIAGSRFGAASLACLPAIVETSMTETETTNNGHDHPTTPQCGLRPDTVVVQYRKSGPGPTAVATLAPLRAGGRATAAPPVGQSVRATQDDN